MPDGGFVSAMERKIAAGRPAADPVEMTPARAFSIALARAAERMARLPLRVVTSVLKEQSAEEIVESLPEPALLATLDGPKGALGLAALGCGTVAALVEMMMLGRIGINPPPPRRPTRTDAAMLAGFIDGVLAEMDKIVPAEPAAEWLTEFHYGALLGDPRPLALMLDAPRYRVLRADIAFGEIAGNTGNEARRGEVIVLVPGSGRVLAQTAKNSDRSSGTRETPGGTGWGERLERVVLHSNTEVTAVLARITLPLSSLLQLNAGVSLTLPDSSLAAVQLHGADGRLLSLCHLGQGNGRRAVRIAAAQPNDPPVAPSPSPARIIPAEADRALIEPAHAGLDGAQVRGRAPDIVRPTLDDPQRRAWEEALHGPDTGSQVSELVHVAASA
jgi:flagellar motor switch protein FliM